MVLHLGAKNKTDWWYKHMDFTGETAAISQNSYRTQGRTELSTNKSTVMDILSHPVVANIKMNKPKAGSSFFWNTHLNFDQNHQSSSGSWPIGLVKWKTTMKTLVIRHNIESQDAIILNKEEQININEAWKELSGRELNNRHWTRRGVMFQTLSVRELNNHLWTRRGGDCVSTSIWERTEQPSLNKKGGQCFNLYLWENWTTITEQQGRTMFQPETRHFMVFLT